MLQIMILVCSINLSPADCQLETALDVISGPQTQSVVACGLQGQSLIAQLETALDVISGPQTQSVVACGLQGQSLIAATSIARRGPDEYIKIKCSRVVKTAQKS